MASLDSWLVEIGGSVELLGNVKPLEMMHSADLALSRATAVAGFPGVLPLWAAAKFTVGLVAVPHRDPQNWPGVMLKDGQGLTVATDASTLLPQALILRILSNPWDIARQVAERWSELGPKILALHRILGGSDKAIDAFASAIADATVRDLFRNKDTRELAQSRLCRAIDRSEFFTSYADWIDGFLASGWTQPQEPERYGPWARRVLCLASRVSPLVPLRPKLPTQWLQGVIEGNAGVDSGVPIDVSWSVQPSEADGAIALVEAAMLINEVQSLPDPIAEAIVKALRTERTSYKGLAHAEAVVALDEGGQPERAWDVLQSAAWWAALNTGQVPQAMFDGARFLANRHQWEDIGWVLERARGEA